MEVSAYLNPQSLLEEIGIASDMKVGAFGCGSGYMAFAASRLVGRRGTVFAVDILKPSLDHIRSQAMEKGITNIKTVWSNLEMYGATAIPDQSLDLGMAVNVLFINMDHRGLLTEVKRMLKNGALLLVVEWKGIDTPFGPPVAHRLRKEYVKGLLNELGLNRITEFDPSQYHYALLYRR